MSSATTTLLLLICTVCCTSASQIFQKRLALSLADDQKRESNRPVLLNNDFLISCLLLGAGIVFWLLVLRRLDVSIAYPLLSINYVIVMLCAKWLFGETIPTHRWVGAFAIIAGICVLASGTAA